MNFDELRTALNAEQYEALTSGPSNPEASRDGSGTSSSQGPVPAGTSFSDGHCDVCGAPRGKHHLSYCDLRGDV